jgi:hypothetical protein
VLVAGLVKGTFAEMSAVVPADDFGGVVDRLLEWHQRAARRRLATHYVFPKQAHNLRSMVARIGDTGSATANCCAGSVAMRRIATLGIRDRYGRRARGLEVLSIHESWAKKLGWNAIMDKTHWGLKSIEPQYPDSTARLLPLEDVLKFRRDYVNNIPPEAALVLLTIRGFLLWLVIPIGFLAWLSYFWWARSASLGQCLG